MGNANYVRPARQSAPVQRPFSAACGRRAVRRMSFDRNYYARYYFDPRTAVSNAAEMRARARLIAAMTQHADLPVRRILEAGCGTGLLRTALRRLLPRAEYVGLEASEYLCGRYGWECGRVEDDRTRTPFALVICYDVLQYREQSAAARRSDRRGADARILLGRRPLPLGRRRLRVARRRLDCAAPGLPLGGARVASGRQHLALQPRPLGPRLKILLG